MKKCCIFVNGNMKTSEFYKETASSHELLISADGASNRLFELGIVPDYIVGDLDSIKSEVEEYYKTQKTVFIKFPAKKDKTDTELAIDLAKDMGYSNITMLGFLGERLDHMLGNIFMLYYAQQLGLKLELVDENNKAWLITKGKAKILNEKGRTISFITLGDNAYGITLKGFAYPLDNYNLELGSTRCISNIVSEDEAEIELDIGKLIAILTNPEL